MVNVNQSFMVSIIVNIMVSVIVNYGQGKGPGNLFWRGTQRMHETTKLMPDFHTMDCRDPAVFYNVPIQSTLNPLDWII